MLIILENRQNFRYLRKLILFELNDAFYVLSRARCLFIAYLWEKPRISRSIERERTSNGQESLIEKLLKRPTRKTSNKRKGGIHFTQVASTCSMEA